MDPATAAFLLSILPDIAAGLGVAAILGLAAKSPQAYRWLRRYLLGSNILVLGQARAGKTSFYNYLEHGEFADTHPTLPTDRVSSAMRFSVDRGGELKFEVSKAFDVPGDLPVDEQIEILRRKKPKALVIFLKPLKENEDVPNWLPADKWLRHFAAQLKSLTKEDRGAAKALRCLTVVLNKSDCVNDAEKTKICARLGAVIKDELEEILGSGMERVKILPCSLRKDKSGEILVKSIVLELVSCLQKNQRLIKT